MPLAGFEPAIQCTSNQEFVARYFGTTHIYFYRPASLKHTQEEQMIRVVVILTLSMPRTSYIALELSFPF
jgi:hypothetical protein